MKSVQIFSKNFHNFRFDTVEKQSIEDLSNYKSRSYIFVVLSYSEIIFLRMQTFVSYISK